MGVQNEGTFQITQNLGVNDEEFGGTTVRQRNTGWGASPLPNRDVQLMPSQFGSARVVANTLPSADTALSAITSRGTSAHTTVAATTLPLNANALGGDLMVGGVASSDIAGGYGGAGMNDSRIPLIAGSHTVYAGFLNDDVPLDPLTKLVTAAARLCTGFVFIAPPASLSGVTGHNSVTDMTVAGSLAVPVINATAVLLVVALERPNGTSNPLTAPPGYTQLLVTNGNVNQIQIFSWVGAGPTNPAANIAYLAQAATCKTYVSTIGLVHKAS